MNMDNDELDGCEMDFERDAVDDDFVAFLPLFPDANQTAKWTGVFDGS